MKSRSIDGVVNFDQIQRSQKKQKIRISWDGDEEYSGFEKETDVIMTEREQMKFNLKEAPYEAGLVFDHDQNIDYTANSKSDLRGCSGVHRTGSGF